MDNIKEHNVTLDNGVLTRHYTVKEKENCEHIQYSSK